MKDTTSMAAGAYWWPHKAYPEARVAKWAKRTYDIFAIDQHNPATGVHFEEHFRFCLDPDDGGYARHLVDTCETIDGSDFGIPSHEAYRLIVPVIDVPVFMPYVHKCVAEAGGQFFIQELESPAALFTDYDLVINCTGVWAYTFVQDKSVFPIRGQAVRLTLPAGLIASTRIFQKVDKFTLILPRTNDLILGGTADENSWNREPSEEDTQRIIDRCAEVVPAVADAQFIDAAVGLRPGRKEVRLELDLSTPSQPVIHNYGHGGGGFTICWGCAEEVVRLAEQYFEK